MQNHQMRKLVVREMAAERRSVESCTESPQETRNARRLRSGTPLSHGKDDLILDGSCGRVFG